jgi:hypothetical protein
VPGEPARDPFQCHARNLSGYDSMHRGLGQTELSGNDADTSRRINLRGLPKESTSRNLVEFVP